MSSKGTDRSIDRSPEAKRKFADLLKAAREMAGVKQPEMARMLGLKHMRYWQYEIGNCLPKTQSEKERIEEMARSILEGREAGLLEEQEQEHGQPPAEESLEELAESEALESESSRLECIDEPKERANPYAEDRSFDEQMQDLGVEVVRVPAGNNEQQEQQKDQQRKITNIVRFKKQQMPGKLQKNVRINKYSIGIGREVLEMLGGPGVTLEFGAGDFDAGNGVVRALLVWVVKNGYPLNMDKSSASYRINGSSLTKRLVKAGLETGIVYRIRKVSSQPGFFVGVPEK